MPESPADPIPDTPARVSTMTVFAIAVGVALLLVVGFVAGYVVGRDVHGDDKAMFAGPGAMMDGGAGGAGMMGRRDESMHGPGGMMGSMMGSMMDSMEVDSEAQYLASMIPHHDEAIESAKLLKAGTDSDEMREFADSIISSQQAQVDDMRDWLQEWYPDTDPDGDYEPMMREGLDELEGEALDDAFLEDMIVHHMMAVHMSQQLLADELATHDEVEQLARDIAEEQHREIFRMRRWLAA